MFVIKEQDIFSFSMFEFLYNVGYYDQSLPLLFNDLDRTYAVNMEIMSHILTKKYHDFFLYSTRLAVHYM